MSENSGFAVEEAKVIEDDILDITDDTLSFDVTDGKPFNACFSCRYFRKGCSGPNLMAMTPERVYEFFQLCRAQLHYTYQKTAELSRLATITVQRILTGKSKDPGLLSIMALSSVLVGDPTGKYPCPMYNLTTDAEEAIVKYKDAAAKLEHVEKELSDERKKIEFLKEQVKFKDSQTQAKDEVIRDNYSFFKRKNSIIVVLAILLGISVATIVAALIVDTLNPNIGFFWLNS